MKVWRMCLTVFFIFIVLFFGNNAEAVYVVSWNPNTEPNLAGYRVYWAFTYQSVADKTAARTDVVNRTSCCLTIDEGSNPVVFVGVSAYDTSGNESNVTVGYILFGNIEGTYNDGIPYTSARVDGFDLTVLGVNFGLTVTHQTYECSSNFAIQIPTQLQKSDLNGDGRIDGLDLIKLGLSFGNAAN